MSPEAGLSREERAALDSLCQQVFGTRCAIGGYRIVRRSLDYRVLLAELTDPALEVAVKLAGPRAALACPFERTATIMRQVRERTSVPVAEVLAVDVSCREWPWRYLITTQLPGVRWIVARQEWSAADRGRLWRQLGEAVAALHALRFPAYGEIAADGVVEGESAYPPALLARAQRRLADPQHLAHFRAALASRPDLLVGTGGACLSHEDLNPTNLLVASAERNGNWHLSGIVDFDSAWAGSADSDLARLALWEGMTGDEFWAGYGLPRTLTPPEEERRLLHQLLWCLEYASTSPRHRADTARVCAALGLPAISFD